ncbi:hypothetical protein Tco_0904416 [Tanacetum coccineum]
MDWSRDRLLSLSRNADCWIREGHSFPERLGQSYHTIHNLQPLIPSGLSLAVQYKLQAYLDPYQDAEITISPQGVTDDDH